MKTQFDRDGEIIKKDLAKALRTPPKLRTGHQRRIVEVADLVQFALKAKKFFETHKPPYYHG